MRAGRREMELQGLGAMGDAAVTAGNGMRGEAMRLAARCGPGWMVGWMLLLGGGAGARAQATAAVGTAGTVPTFTVTVRGASLTMVGGDPAKGGVTTIPTLLVPVRLDFAQGGPATEGKPVAMDARAEVARLQRSPIFHATALPASGGTGTTERTQYGDAMLRATFGAGSGLGKANAVPDSAKPLAAAGWHVLLGSPQVRPVTVEIPAGYGYVLQSKHEGRSVAVADAEYVQREVMRQIGPQAGRLVMAVTHNTAFYALGDATVCCSWGAHGVDTGEHGPEYGKGGGTGNSFVLASVLDNAPGVVTDRDVQPLSAELAEFLMDPLHDTMEYRREVPRPGNAVPAWRRPGMERCAGAGVGAQYFDLLPTDTNAKNNFPAGQGYAVGEGTTAFHVANVALLGWYTGTAPGLGSALSFPDAAALTEPAVACPERRHAENGGPAAAPEPTTQPVARTAQANGHALIGYTDGREVAAAQWDVVILAFATPAKGAAAEGTMQFQVPRGMDEASFRANLQAMRQSGRKVMISLGGGGEHFTLADETRVPAFVDSVTKIVTDWGFDGIDIDFESPSLAIDAGDTDFRHPTTPSIVHLLDAMKQLKRHFGPGFLISLVPEGTQTPGGYPSYGGAYGSYLPLIAGLGEDLTFVDTQSYNTPPLQGLDGEIYQPGTVDYHAAMTELLLHGFQIAGRPGERWSFPAVAATKVATGFWTADTDPETVSAAMRYLITGKAPEGTHYRLQQAGGYPGFLGAMFWTIDDDRRENYRFSNRVGPELHTYPAAR